MRDPIIRTRNLSMETIKALLQVLKERSAAENKVILCWKQRAETTNTSLTDEGMNELMEKREAVRGAIKDFLREQGWPWPKIWDSFKEIKAMLANLTTERGTT